MKILVTGSIGFIGFHLCNLLTNNKKNKIFGIDSIDNYYDVSLKKNRLSILKNKKNFKFYKINISNFEKLKNNFTGNKYDIIINLAAQAGVRYSIENPSKYFDSNLKGFFNILELSRMNKIKHLIFASTSSVYGNSSNFPLKEEYPTDKPLSFYAASKKCNEVMAYSYSNIYKLPCTGLRFFTVYGPWGRPDMSLFKFISNITKSKKIELFNSGNHVRDFTYVEDIVKSIDKLISKPSNKPAPFNIFNVGSDNPKSLKAFIKVIEKNLKVKPKFILKKLQKGDVKKTHANVDKLKKYIKFKPSIGIETGISNFVKWFKEYYK